MKDTFILLQNKQNWKANNFPLVADGLRDKDHMDPVGCYKLVSVGN